jgi:hypothetical protein
MPLFRETEPEIFVQWLGEPLPTTLQREVPVLDGGGDPVLDDDGRPLMDLEDYVDDVRHPLAVEQLWSDEELLAIGLHRPAEADAVPEGKTVIATSVQRVAGVVRYVHELTDATTPIVMEVTMRQARLALLYAGLGAQVDVAIDALPEPQKSATRIEWDFARSLRRDHAMVPMLAAALSLTEEDLDILFYEASQIV